VAKKKVEKGPNHERWLLTYADMITLLMIFFIVLWSMSNADAEKFQKISASLQRAFSVDLFEGKGGSREDSNAQNQAIFDTRMSAFTMIKRQIGAIAETSQVQDQVDVRLAREGIVITLSGNFLFESGRAELRPEAYPILDGVIANLRFIPNEVRVGGHTDNVPIETALYGSNWELSSARAVAVVKYLVAGGIDATRLAAAGYGEFRPVAPNDTRANRAKNRRAELLIVFPDGPPATDPLTTIAPGARQPTPGSAPPHTDVSPDH
jgi:chemotaxis protein MotB